MAVVWGAHVGDVDAADGVDAGAFCRLCCLISMAFVVDAAVILVIDVAVCR